MTGEMQKYLSAVDSLDGIKGIRYLLGLFAYSRDHAWPQAVLMAYIRTTGPPFMRHAPHSAHSTFKKRRV